MSPLAPILQEYFTTYGRVPLLLCQAAGVIVAGDTVWEASASSAR